MDSVYVLPNHVDSVSLFVPRYFATDSDSNGILYIKVEFWEMNLKTTNELFGPLYIYI